MKKKIVACLDILNGRVVKGVNFVNFKDAGDPAEIARFYSENSADELVFLDISATTEDRATMDEVIKKTAKNVKIPFTVGGGIRTLKDADRILNLGASKISINSACVKNPNIIDEIAKEFGSDKLVIAVDVKKIKNKYNVFINAGKINTEKDAAEWGKEVQNRGAGEILLTSMDFDGTKEGYDLEITKKFKESLEIPITASGGAGKKEDFKDAFSAANVDSALAASLFHFGEIKIPELKEYLRKENIDVY